MQPGTLRALEFDRIVEVVRSLALTPLGETRLAQLEPSVSRRKVAADLALTSEAVRFLADYPGFPLRAPSDIFSTLEALDVQGRPLEPQRLLGLSGFVESIDQTGHTIRRSTRGPFPLLAAVAGAAASFEREIAEVRRTIDPAGEVFDHASPELRSIRDRLRRQRSRLRGTLESYVRGKDTAKYLQEQVVTDRNGRYVLLVRAEHRGAIPGIVHGSSSSGATLFLEPLSTVEINNEIVALQEQEAEEVRRILLLLTDAFRARAEELERTLDVGTDLDVIQARARFSRMVDGIEPELSEDGTLQLLGARHPLLVPAVDSRLRNTDPHTGEPTRPARTTGPVPVDLQLVPPTSVLVITGPNTGGKTVALKTGGLLALMAQAGLHVPADAGSKIPVFGSIFADIGDEQSIAANLSTFSWHVTNIASMDRHLALPALVLLDEVGAGTDPVEGGALGMAVIDHFRDRGALVIATTHYDTLKTYASTTAGVTPAGFGFTPDTFEPTYRLMYGSPGRSLALEIAARLGLPPSVVQAARAFQSAREAKLAEHLAKVDHELHSLDHERRLVVREREQLAAAEARIRARDEALKQREEQLKQRLDAQLGERLREARREIDAVVDDVKLKAATLVSQAVRKAQMAAAPLTTGDTGAVRSIGRDAIDRLEERFRREVGDGARPPAAVVIPGAEPPDRAPATGDRVAVGPLALEGIVKSTHGREVEVDVRGKRVRASIDEVRVLRAGGASGPPPKVSVQVQVRDFAVQDLNVIGCHVDEALDRTDKFLDKAVMSALRTVRVIHGHGTGQLRRAIADFLQRHPLVEKYAPAPPEQGGGGVTVVELKE